MSLTPGYGKTPLPQDELNSLLPQARELLGASPTKAAAYDLEQAIQEEITESFVNGILDSSVRLDDLLTDTFLRDLHRDLFGDIWQWAGFYRQRELNIGVAPEPSAVEFRGPLETLHYRWKNTN